MQQRRADQRKFLPYRGRRIRVRPFPRRHVPSGAQVDRDSQPGGDPRRWPAQILQPTVAQLRARLRWRRHQASRAVHVLAVLYRLLRHSSAAR